MKKKTIYKILMGICIIGVIVCICVLWNQKMVQKNANQKYTKLAEQSKNTAKVDTKESEGILADFNISIPEKNIDWDVLKTENPDIYAWIYIPNTNVDYPVVLHPTDDNYYLNHNLDGSEGYPGCIYSESLNKKDFSDPNTVLYGHDMNDGSMFETLHKFEDNLFFEENYFIYIYTPEKNYVYEIYSASEFNQYHILHTYDFQSEGSYNQFLKDVGNVRSMTAHRRDGIGAAYGRKLLTLSTCIATKPDKRWLVTAVLMNED